MDQVDAVIWDLGGVLIDWDPRHLYRQLIDDEDCVERLLSTVCTPAWHEAHDRGHDTSASCAALAAEHPEYETLITAWATRSEDMVAGDIPDAVDLLKALQGRAHQYVLSNMERETFPLRKERFEWMSVFDGFVISGHEGFIKPEPELYDILLERFELRPERTLFVDDRPINLVTAEAKGMRTHLYTGAAGLERRLKTEGLLP